MNDDVRFHARHEVENALAVANIHLVMLKSGDRILQSGLIPACRLGARKSSALVVVHPVNRAALTGKNKETSEPIRPEEPVTSVFISNQRLNGLAPK